MLATPLFVTTIVAVPCPISSAGICTLICCWPFTLAIAKIGAGIPLMGTDVPLSEVGSDAPVAPTMPVTPVVRFAPKMVTIPPGTKPAEKLAPLVIPAAGITGWVVRVEDPATVSVKVASWLPVPFTITMVEAPAGVVASVLIVSNTFPKPFPENVHCAPLGRPLQERDDKLVMLEPIESPV